MTSPFNIDSSIPAGALKSASREVHVAAIRKAFPGVIITNGLDDLRETLKVYSLSYAGISKTLDLGLSSVMSMFKPHFKYIFVSAKPNVRKALAEELESTDKPTSRCFFSPEQVGEFLNANSVAEVCTVAMPLSLFVSDPEAFRAAFLAERSRYESNLAVRGKKTGRTAAPALKHWDCFAGIGQTGKDLVESYFSKIAKWKAEQGLKYNRPNWDVKIPSRKVTFPEGTFPFLTRAATLCTTLHTQSQSPVKRLVRANGIARVTVTTPPLDVQGKAETLQPRFCPGLALGEPQNYGDYAIGATHPVLIEDAIDAFGEEFVFRTWQFCPENTLCHGSKNILPKPIERYWTDAHGARDLARFGGWQLGNAEY